MAVLVAACSVSTAVIVLMIHDRHDLGHSPAWVSLPSAPSYERSDCSQRLDESPKEEQTPLTSVVRTLSFLATALLRTDCIKSLDPRSRPQASRLVIVHLGQQHESRNGPQPSGFTKNLAHGMNGLGNTSQARWYALGPSFSFCITSPWHWCGRRPASRATEPRVAQTRETPNQYRHETCLGGVYTTSCILAKEFRHADSVPAPERVQNGPTAFHGLHALRLARRPNCSLADTHFHVQTLRLGTKVHEREGLKV